MVAKVTHALLAKGMLPRDLPPIFSSRDLGKRASDLESLVTKSTWTKPERYSLPKAKFGRRISFIVNPVPYFLLSMDIGNNWAEIRRHLDKSRLAAVTPGFFGKIRALREIDFKGIRERKIVESSGHGYVLNTDFARFFPTVYTHSIPWALHTKALAKAKQKDYSLLGNRLDRWNTHLQEGQTAGIPIGPDTSYILAEVVAVAIDNEFMKVLGTKHHGLRYVDDFALFFATRAEAERALSCLAQAAREYQIELNPDKTNIASMAEEASEAWVFALGAFAISKMDWGQRDSLAKLTDLAIALYAKHGDTAIGKYAIKKISSTVIANQHIDFAIACILRLCSFSPNAYPDAASFVISYAEAGYSIDLSSIRRFIENTVHVGVGLGNDMEVCWALWIAYRLRLKLSNESRLHLERSLSSVLVTFSKVIADAGLMSGTYRPVLAKGTPTKETFAREHWLLHYEGSRRGWFGWTDAEVKLSLLAPLNANDVTFLDLHPKLTGILVPKTRGPSGPGGAVSKLSLRQLQARFKAKPPESSYGMHADKSDDEDDDEDDELADAFWARMGRD